MAIQSTLARPFAAAGLCGWVSASGCDRSTADGAGGGTDTNPISSPDIDVEKPLTIEIPGCTYNREALLSGA